MSQYHQPGIKTQCSQQKVLSQIMKLRYNVAQQPHDSQAGEWLLTSLLQIWRECVPSCLQYGNMFKSTLALLIMSLEGNLFVLTLSNEMGRKWLPGMLKFLLSMP